MVFDAFTAAFVISLRILLPGAMWKGSEEESEKAIFSSTLRRCATMITVGLCVNLLAVLLLAPFSLWTPAMDWVAWILLSGLGVIVRKNILFTFRKREIQTLASTALFLTISAWIILVAPPRSEWLAGGWDPGIYQNNAVAIAGADGLQGTSTTVYSKLTGEGIKLFSQTEGEYREVFPAVPIEEDTRRIPLYFFHLTPLLGAWLFRFAGIEGVIRLPLFLGVWMIPLLWRLFDAWGFKKASLLGVLCWMMFPLWHYQLAIPTAEMLYLLLLVSFLTELSVQSKETWSHCLWIALLTFLATINHFNFPLVGGCILCGFAWESQGRIVLGLKRRLPAALLGMWGGAVWNFWQAPVTLSRLQAKDHAVTIVVGGLTLLTLVGLLLVRYSLPEKFRLTLQRVINVSFAAFGLILVGIGGCLLVSFTNQFLPPAPEMMTGLFRLSQFSGAGFFVAAGVGLLFLSRQKSTSYRVFRASIIGLGLLLLLFLVQPGISPIYPWALRRYLIVAAPLFAGLSCFAIMLLISTRQKWWAPTFFLVSGVLIAGFLHSLPVLHAAGSVGDYRGFSTWMSQVMRTLEPDDIVVADDPRWGTPLLLSQGLDVINGKHIWEETDPAVRKKAYAELKRLASKTQRRIVWLTSTDMKLEVYPDPLPVQQTLFKEIEYRYPTVIHSGRADHFATQMRRNSFGLYVVDMESLNPVYP